jgi:undecaprenyl diphosphate synthase
MPESIGRVIEFLLSKEIKKLYLWCNSLENLKNRPIEEIFSFLNNYLLITNFTGRKIKVILKGDIDIFKSIHEGRMRGFYDKFKNLEEQTKDNTEFNLFYFINYSTISDLEKAIEKSKGCISFLHHMDEPEDIDIVLRTGGHKRLSGFTPIKSYNAEYLFLNEWFPDISQNHISIAHKMFLNRKINNGV